MTRALTILAVAVLAVAASGCGRSMEGSAGSPGGAGSGRRSVVVGLYPLAFVAERVGGDRVSVRSLAKPGAEPHDLELTPRQVQQVAEADLVLYLPGLQPALDEAVGERARDSALDALAAARAAAATSAPAGDPHVWLDPRALAGIAEATAQRLERIDPGSAEGYRDRSERTVTELTALDADAARALRSCRTRTIVTAHAAFGHLAARYGLRQVAIGGLDPQAEPSPARIRAVVRAVRGDGVSTVFVEPLVDSGAARVVASALGARTAVLDPVEAVRGDDDYLTVMRRNVRALSDGLGCR